MLLRSSSTPIHGSLLPSFSDIPNNNNHHHDTNTSFKHQTLHHQQSFNKLQYLQSPGYLNLTTGSCNSSPISPSIAGFSEQSHKCFRRVQSEGSLEGLAYASCNDNEEYYNPSQHKKISGRPKCMMLDTIPSFSFRNSRGQYEEEEEEEEGTEIQDEEEREQPEEKVAMESECFGISNKMESMVLSEEMRVMDRIWNVGLELERGLISEELYLARGLGIDGGINNGNSGGGNGGGDEFNSAGGDGGDIHGTEEYYKRMVQENPGNALFLRNYAQFLYQSKHDLQGAEEYYSRAILADPKDGDILSQYAKLIWELHHDQDRASSYFECAVQASPEDSHVHAAYASFLWETEEDEDEYKMPKNFDPVSPQFHQGAMASAGASSRMQ